MPGLHVLVQGVYYKRRDGIERTKPPHGSIATNVPLIISCLITLFKQCL